MNTNTFEITIQHKVDQEWPVIVVWRDSRKPVESRLLLQDISKLQQEPSIDYGHILGAALFHGEVGKIFIDAIEYSNAFSTDLRVFLNIEDTTLKTLHWTCLRAPIDADTWKTLAKYRKTPFSFYLPSHDGNKFPSIRRKDLRVLIVIANPTDLNQYGFPSIQFDKELKAIEEELESVGIEYKKLVYDKLVENSISTLEALRNTLSGGIHYSLLLVVCHGKVNGNDTILYWAKANNGKNVEVEKVSGTRLISELNNPNVHLPHCIFLASCDTAKPVGEVDGLAQRLVRDLGIPVVIGMEDSVGRDTAMFLGRNFYKNLCENNSSGEADGALAHAYTDLSLPSKPLAGLYSRLGSLPLFTSDHTPTLEISRETLKILATIIDERAPILKKDFERVKTQLQSIGIEDDPEYEQVITVLNTLCEEVADISFMALANGQEPAEYDNCCPFREGSLDQADQNFFFGRETVLNEIQQKLQEYHFLAVVGPSGCGKSSLVLAGLKQREPQRKIVSTEPHSPLPNISDSETILIVDQFEEVFIECSDLDRSNYITQLITLTETCRVIITMRSDFLEVCQTDPNLNNIISDQNKIVLAPMLTAELRQVIGFQAAQAGLLFEADLSYRIIKGAEALPLAQATLVKLWGHRHGRWLRGTEYQTLGEAHGVILAKASVEFEKFSSEEQQAILAILIRLTQFGSEPEQNTRRQVNLEELVPAGGNQDATRKLVKQLADERLVVTTWNEATRKATVRVMHEALIQNWDKLRKLFDTDRDRLLEWQKIRDAAQAWDFQKRDESLLTHQGRELEKAKALAQKPPIDLNTLEQIYINACAERQQRLRFESLAKNLSLQSLFQHRINQNITAALLARQAYLFLQQSQRLTPIQADVAVALQTALEAFYFKTMVLNNESAVMSIAFSRDGKFLAIGGQDGTVRVWDLAQPAATPRVLIGHNCWVLSVAFNPANSTKLASSSADNNIKLWDLSQPSAVRDVFSGDASWRSYVPLAFSPNGNILAFSRPHKDTPNNDECYIIELNDLNQPTASRILDTQAKHLVCSVDFNQEGTRLASSSWDGRVQLWDITQTAATPRILRDGNIPMLSVAFSPDGNRLASGSGEGEVHVWDLPPEPTSKPITLRILTGHKKEVTSVAFSPDGNRLASGSTDRTVQLWNLSQMSAAPRVLVGHENEVTAVAFSPDGNHLTSCSKDKTVRLWDMRQRAVAPHVFTGLPAVLSVAFSPNERYIACGCSGGKALVWDLTNPEASPRVFPGGGGAVPSIAFSPDGNRLASSGYADKVVRIWDLTQPSPPNPRDLVGHKNRVTTVAFSPDGMYLASSGWENMVLLWDLKPSNPLTFTTLHGHSTSVEALAFSPNGKLLASGSYDNTVRLWDLTQPDAKPRILNHKDAVLSVAFSPDNRLLASGSRDMAVQVWDLTQPTTEPYILDGHADEVTSVAFSPDGSVLASGSNDWTVWLWELTHSIASSRVLTGHEHRVRSVAFSPKGTYFASGSEDGTVRVWNIQIEYLSEQICEQVGRNLTENEWQKFIGTDIPYQCTCSKLPSLKKVDLGGTD